MNTFISKKFPIRKLSALRKKLLAFSCKLSAFRNLQPTRPPRLLSGKSGVATYNLQPTRGFTLLNPAKREFRQRQNYLTGFTLVEMLVSISVFLVVMLVAASSLLSIIDGNSKAQSLKSAINNLNFSLESMAKNIRVGTDYSVSSCSPANTCISFDSYKDLNGDGNMNNDTVIYKYREDDSVNHTGLIERCTTVSAICTMGSTFTRLTAPEVKITNMKFYVSAPSGEAKPRVLLTISGKAGSKMKIETNFNIQTTVSQRQF